MSLEVVEDNVELRMTHLDSKNCLDHSSIEEVRSSSIATGISSSCGLNLQPAESLLGSPNGMTTGALAAAHIVSSAGGGGSLFILVSSSESDSC